MYSFRDNAGVYLFQNEISNRRITTSLAYIHPVVKHKFFVYHARIRKTEHNGDICIFYSYFGYIFTIFSSKIVHKGVILQESKKQLAFFGLR
jgi:hypothetical protein